MGNYVFSALNEEELSALKSENKCSTLTKWETEDLGFVYLRPLSFSQINSILGIYLSPSDLQTASAMKTIKKLLVSPNSDLDKNKVLNHLFLEHPEEGALMLLHFIEKLENASFQSFEEV